MTYTNKSYMGSGDLFFQRYDTDGVTLLRGLRQVGNADAFAVEAPSVEKAERKGKMRQNWGQTIHSIVKSVEQGLSLTLTDFYPENVAVGMFGESAAQSQTAGSDAAPVTVSAFLGEWSDLGHMKLDPATPPVVQDDTDTTTYTENVDYEIDYQGGLIMPIGGAAITDGQVLHATSTWLDYTGTKIEANQFTQVEVKIVMLTENKAGAGMGRIIVPKVQLEPTDAMGWLSDDYINLGFGGNIITVAAGAWSYEEF